MSFSIQTGFTGRKVKKVLTFLGRIVDSVNIIKSDKQNQDKFFISQMSDEIQSHVLALYKPIKKIGSGAYGIVWKVTERKNKALKALKKNFDAFTNSTDAQRTYRQIMFLKQLKHPNIIRLDNIIRAQNDKDIYLVFQHMDIDLHTLIRENSNNEHLQEKHKQYIIYQLAKSILYLHNSDIIHRDLKPSNVLINENCEAKLCDFGLVRSLQEPQDNEMVIMTDYIATRWYRAPQLLLGCKDYSKEIDIWALGCLIGQMMRGKPLFPGTSTINQIQRILNWTGSPTSQQIKNLRANVNKGALDLLTARKKAHKSDFFPHINSQCLDLIKRTLQFDPTKRINILEVIQHPYLSEFYNKKQIDQICRKKVSLKLHINDNIKLSLKNYRSLIYSQIQENNSGREKYPTHQFVTRSSKNNSSLLHHNNHIKKTNVQDRKNSLQKDKTEKRFKTQVMTEEDYSGLGSNYATSNNLKTANSNKKYTVFKEVTGNKLISNKKTIPSRQRQATSMSLQKKKGISLCSKEVSGYSKNGIKSTSVHNKPCSSSVYNSSFYYPSSQTQQSVQKEKKSTGNNKNTKLGHYKKVKVGYKYSLEKGNSSLSHYDKNKKMSAGNTNNTIYGGWFVNDNIGRKDSFN